MKPCPCCSGLEYEKCCLPYIKGGAKAPTAQALMRSRYSAYAEHEIDYIINTCVHRSNNDIDPKSTREWSEQSKWLGLKIISAEKGGISDNEGIVEFEALYERGGLKETHHETARFKKQNDEWLYEDGKLAAATVVRASPKPGRNDPCPCGSGKKYKHCCL
jgi:SEC-C motif-containing protein